MSKKSELNSRHLLFLLKISACVAGLLGGSLLLAPTARMQDDNVVVANSNMMMNGNYGNYRPTPEPPKSTVRGRVFYEDTGRAVKRTSIMLMSKEGGREASGLTDNNGSFQIKNVVAGTYYAFVNAPGVVSPLAYADFTKPQTDGLEQAAESSPAIVVSGAGNVNVEVPVRRGGAISGRVMYADGDAAIGVKVEILRKIEGIFVPVIPNFSSTYAMSGGDFQTDDRGVYRFAGLPNGEYVVKVTENVAHGNSGSLGYRGIEENLFVGSSLLALFYPNALTTEKAQTVNVAAGQETSEINLYIPERQLFNVEGRIINVKDRSPIKNAAVSLTRSGENTFLLFADFGRTPNNSQSDKQGNWNFNELPKGTYTLTVEPSNYQYDDTSGYMSNVNSNRASNAPPKLAKKTQEITIDDQNLSEIVIELGYGATISGTVKTENNQKMPETVTINAVQDDSEASSSTATVYNSSFVGNSAYAVGNGTVSPTPRKPEHDFKLEAVPTGKTFLWATVNNLDYDFYVKSAIFNGVDLLTNPLELKEGDVLRNVQFVIAKDSGTLKGTVLNGDKQPAKNTVIMLLPVEAAKRKNPNTYRSAISGENGEFEVKAPPGEYAIIFFTKEFTEGKTAKLERLFDEAVKNAPKATIKPNETEKISLTVPK